MKNVISSPHGKRSHRGGGQVAESVGVGENSVSTKLGLRCDDVFRSREVTVVVKGHEADDGLSRVAASGRCGGGNGGGYIVFARETL